MLVNHTMAIPYPVVDEPVPLLDRVLKMITPGSLRAVRGGPNAINKRGRLQREKRYWSLKALVYSQANLKRVILRVFTHDVLRCWVKAVTEMLGGSINLRCQTEGLPLLICVPDRG